MSDLTVLDFLWTWKVASTPMLREAAYRRKSPWWIYKSLRQLRDEKYIELLPRSKNLEQELWTLTEHGFEIVLMGRDDISEYRYRVHAPAHDYLGSCLQLGELWPTGIEARYYTEQMLATLAPRNFPKGFREKGHSITGRGHVPDGITVIPSGLKEAVIAYEVDLNLKDENRYRDTWSYYHYEVKPHLIVWLVRSPWIANRIASVITEGPMRRDQDEFLNKIAFVIMADFKQRIWGAEAIMGEMKGLSLRKLHANLLQTLGKDAAKIGQTDMREIFFPRFRSPQKSFTYEKGGELKDD